MEADIQKLKAQAADLKITVWVGKNGVTDSIIEELENQLISKKLVKVKILKNAPGQAPRNRLVRELEEKSGATLVETRGGVAVYLSPYRKKTL